MPKTFTPKVVTANHLLEGDAVWLTDQGEWSADPALAALLTDEDQAQERLHFAQTQPHLVVGPYLADAKAGPNGPEPTHFREAFRRRGPSNYTHGKQVEFDNV